MPDIQLNFVNNSNDANDSMIVIFQKNAATDFDELAVAWKVIKYCGQGDNHPFTYPMAMMVGASDAWGNHTPQFDAQYGQLFSMSLTQSGDTLQPQGSGSSPDEVEVLNSLPEGTINAGIYKNGALLAQKTLIAPQQKAVFRFEPTLWIGIVSEVDQGQIMNSAIISSINTELSLQGVASADIWMTGGGSGNSARPFMFSLQNVVMA